MGTHPIFESDFDCLTEMTRLPLFSLLLTYGLGQVCEDIYDDQIRDCFLDADQEKSFCISSGEKEQEECEELKLEFLKKCPCSEECISGCIDNTCETNEYCQDYLEKNPDGFPSVEPPTEGIPTIAPNATEPAAASTLFASISLLLATFAL